MAKSERGFSLIEMIVTLAIMAFALSVTVPPIVRMVEAAAFREGIDLFSREVENIRVQAFINGASIIFDPAAPASGPLASARSLAAQGWTFSGDPIAATALGVCLGGAVTVRTPDERSATLTVSAPDCHTVNGRL
jgi:prepilin-type N-terminal cleavage/methylation domain-containing protein